MWNQFSVKSWGKENKHLKKNLKIKSLTLSLKIKFFQYSCKAMMTIKCLLASGWKHQQIDGEIRDQIIFWKTNVNWTKQIILDRHSNF